MFMKLKKAPRKFSNKAGWREVGTKKIYFRSQWEYQVALYLEALQQQALIRGWEYEPKIFRFDKIKCGNNSYKPDFQVTREDLSVYWIEVKGYMCSSSLTKLKRFKRYFPDEEHHVIDKDWFKQRKLKRASPNDLWILKEKVADETGET